MSALRKSVKINEHTTLLDIGMQGTYGLTAVYLIQGERTCLIDGGTRTEADRLVRLLNALAAFPDCIILTHPHWDHTQGIPALRREASRRGKKMEVLAAHDAVPLLADPSFNQMFNRGPYEAIQDVTPLRENDTVNLGGITLRVLDVPGHCRGHIAILDELSRTVFVGDALGIKVADDIFLPAFMPPSWDPAAFQASIAKLRGIPYQTLCLAHFGCTGGGEAHTILDQALSVWHTWWQFYERHADRLNDGNYLLQAMRRELKPGLPPLRPTSAALRLLLPLISAIAALFGRKDALMDKLAYGDSLLWLAEGYQTYVASQA